MFCGEWCIGRIYETRTGPADLRWFWALHAPGGRETLRASNQVATLEIAKAEFEASWKQWRRGRGRFLHARQVGRAGYAALEPGQVVRYEIGTNPKNGREMAINLQLKHPILAIRSRMARNNSGSESTIESTCKKSSSFATEVEY